MVIVLHTGQDPESPVLNILELCGATATATATAYDSNEECIAVAQQLRK